MIQWFDHIPAYLVTGASLLMSLLLLGLWRVSGQPRERFLLLAGIAQMVFALHQMPLFFSESTFANWYWRASFSAMFGVYLGLTGLVVNLLFDPPSRLFLRLTKWYLWLVVPISFYIFGVFDFTGYLSRIYVQHRLTANNLTALIANIGLALIVVRKFYQLQQQLLQSRMEARFSIERAQLVERQRIMSDMHDTVGSQLVGVLALIRGGAHLKVIEEHAADALQGLRIAVDAIQPVNGNLAAVLATLRHRLQPRLEAAGLQLRWRVDDLPRLDNLTPVKIQHIQRIVMEVFSNVIQHAKASNITVSAKLQAEHESIEITIADDGVGFDSQAAAGQGLVNLHARAAAIGAELAIGKVEARGTIVKLTLPSHF